MKSNTIYLLLVLFCKMGFNIFIGINKFIFAGWCVLVSFSSWAENDQRAFSSWAENDQRAFDTDPQMYM
jgi:hypothetical protein